MAKFQKKQKQTPETLRKLEEAFSYDAPVTEACALAGISQDTYYRWIKEDPALSERFSRLRNNPTYKARKVWIDSFDKDPKNAIEYLKRKRGKEFGDKLQAELSATVDHNYKLSGEVKLLVDEFDKKLLERYAKGDVIDIADNENQDRPDRLE